MLLAHEGKTHHIYLFQIMELQDWLYNQRSLYTNLPVTEPPLATHPVSGRWQTSPYLKNQFWWGGGASQEACQQIQACSDPTLTQLGVIGFGPVQSFLGSGSRLRDWAVASWLCHYLSAAIIFRWQERGGRVLLPLHESQATINWLRGEEVSSEEFWRPGLPNVITGVFPDRAGWLESFQQEILDIWNQLIAHLETAAIAHCKKLDGIGWQVIRSDHQYLWSVYAEQTPLRSHQVIDDIDKLHKGIESQKLGRQWQKPWWGGFTSPNEGSLSIWHPGLIPVSKGGTWGLPRQQLNSWWESLANQSPLKGMVSQSDRLNSMELVKRLASIPKIIETTLESIWNRKPPTCPWESFPDRTAVAAAWVPETVDAETWNHELEIFEDFYFENFPPKKAWGIPKCDREPKFIHPRVLERRNIEDPETLTDWRQEVPQDTESTIEWTVGWRGDGDNMGQWLSGEQYQQRQLLWSQWHLTSQQIQQYQLDIDPPQVPADTPRKIELPHCLDLSILFDYWNRLLYPLTEQHHPCKVIFAGGDDFLLLGPITETIELTSDLHRLWTGESSPVTQPLDPPTDGWTQSLQDNCIYPVPGQQMSFSLGVVIAQRRIPQSLWHQGLNNAYKQAKYQGRNRVCVQVLFNSGQTIEWVCPWTLWHLLMTVSPPTETKTELNAWEKLLDYLQSTHLQQYDVADVADMLDTLWASVGLPLRWQQIEATGKQGNWQEDIQPTISDWSWWLDWISIRGFLARQARERQNCLQRFVGGQT